MLQYRVNVLKYVYQNFNNNSVFKNLKRMFFKKTDSVGTKTISKIAEMAFKKQIKRAENLSIKVKTNPQQLAKGILDSLDIDGDGLIMQKNLSLEKIKINLNNIAVSPFKALMGNVELTQPSKGKACITLNEKDIETALDMESLNRQLSKNHQNIKAKFDQINFSILDDESVAIKTKLRRLDSNDIENISLIIKPRLCHHKQGVIIEEAVCTQGNRWSSILINALLKEASKILNLDNLSVEGIFFQVNHLKMEEGKINLLALTGITQLPIR